jgi:alkyl sulfatase BDS1-like metallo-beta-lactamase superfamily hydrolase
MATLSAIKDALDHTVENRIPGIKGYADITDVTQVPAMVVMPARDTADFTGAMGRGLVTWRFDLYILVARGEVTVAQNKLDLYINPSGPQSIPEILFLNADLGLSDGTDAFVEGVREYGGKFTTARIDHVGAILRVVVRTPGK